jgi:hypothetical protein
MSSELTEIITSISRAANTVLELDIFLCLSGDPKDDYPPQRRVEDSHRNLVDAATQWAHIVAADPDLHPLTNLVAQLDGGIEQLWEGMQILARYRQASQREIERAAGLVNAGYYAIDKVLRAVVDTAELPIEIFLPKYARIHRQYSLLLASLVERFAERMAVHASH